MAFGLALVRPLIRGGFYGFGRDRGQLHRGKGQLCRGEQADLGAAGPILNLINNGTAIAATA